MGIKKENKPAGLTKNTDLTKKELEKLQEGFPMIGGMSYMDYGWTLLTKDEMRDLAPLIQDRMQDIAFYLYDSNPIAHRIIEMTKDFVIGDGFTYKAEDDKVQEVLDKHWEDASNNWDIKQDQKAMELGLYGEQFYPVFINPYSGHVKLGYIDPVRIKRVRKDPNNPEVLLEVILKPNKKGETKKYKVINPDKKGRLDGEIFVFTINKVSNASRGRSDLLSLADWIDGYDQFLFARLERANILNNFVWDVLLEGASESEIQSFLEKQAIPKPGSIRAHNEKVTWKAVAPELAAADASKEANIFKMQILGGAGFPNLWFGEGGETIRAGAAEMSLPTLKHLKSRQKYFRFVITHIFKFVIDQAIKAGHLPKDINTKFKVFSPPLTKKREVQLGVAAGRIADALKIAQDSEWVTKEQAGTAFKTFMKDVIGLDLGGLMNKEKTETRPEKE